MRLRLPEVRNQERSKHSRVVEVDAPEQVAELVAGGGVVLDEVEPQSRKPAAKKGKED
jgi:hypothetical protein